ncbi:MAG: hypothetical protein ACRDA3_02485 [Peptostreptococcaceae bacterium]
MKKAIILSFILCSSLISVKHIKPLVFAESSDKTSVVEQNESIKQDTQDVIEQNESTKQDTQDVTEQNESTKQDTQDVIEQNESTKQDTQDVIEQNESTKQDTQDVVEQNESIKQDIQDVTEQNSLTQEQAKHLLIKYNDKVNYIYQGDENNFEALKSKNLSGYVFLPDVETDIGFFVDKNTSHIYFFHPSGYIELAQ